ELAVARTPGAGRKYSCSKFRSGRWSTHLTLQARLRGRNDCLADIGIKNGRITNIAQRLEGKAVTEIDANGNLVTEPFVNPHLHLCKVWTLSMMEEEALKSYQGEAMGKAMAGI